MNALKLLPVIVSLLLMSAHLLRAQMICFAFLSLHLPLLLFARRKWVARFTQVLLVLSAAEWVRTVYALVSERQATGQPWIRMAMILGGVAAFTALSALVFQSRSLRKRYRLNGASGR